MKAFLFLSAFFLASCFEATLARDDHDIRMENFLNNSLAAFPEWLKRNGYAPDPLDRGNNGKFALTTEYVNSLHLNITGNVWNRFYHGAERNIEADDMGSDLSNSNIYIDIAYGDDESFLEGEYSLDGTIWQRTPIHGDGKFRRTNILRKMSDSASCFLDVTDEGYFKIVGCITSISNPPFQTYTLNGLDDEARWGNIAPAVEGVYRSQYEFEGPRIAEHWADYMEEVFAVTPISDIVGAKFNSKVVTSANESRNIPKVGSEKIFDKELKVWRQQTYTTYDNN